MVVSCLLLVLPQSYSPAGGLDNAPAGNDCGESWYRRVESLVGTGDQHGHGPDLGSGEWKSTVEFRLNVRGLPEVPAADSAAWCRYINDRLSGE
jgi:hypothetical protein